MAEIKYSAITPESDIVAEAQIPLIFEDCDNIEKDDTLKVLSLFSGCGGMDLGFEGCFIANKKSISPKFEIESDINEDWVLVKKTRFKTIFANDILQEAEVGWTNYMSRFGYSPAIYHLGSIVELVKLHRAGVKIFPDSVDVVLGGFPCQDFSVAGKRKGFESQKDDMGKKRTVDAPSEESRGKLYFWMKQVIDIVHPKIFIAENVKGLVNLGNVKDIIQHDFASADGGGYIVLPPQVLHAGNYGVPETRERVIFIGIRRDALEPEALQALESDQIPADYNPYPLPTHDYLLDDNSLLPPVTTYDVLKDLKEPEDSVDPSQQVFSRAKYLANGSQGQVEIKLDGLGPTIRSEHHGNIEFRRLSMEHGGTHLNELGHGLKERRLTPRECAMIQTFPPDYQFVIKKRNGRGYSLSSSGAYKIIGNAVPPVLAYNIAMRIQELWSKYFG
ncbi:DNA cytosine methyltransferase [Prevotella sp. KH2C16]|uniref:DNA cytosine methyltransferase n=1 Tax=Prevotella sp. KH2C16 TaxID=1855325 RepID=UPI0008E5CA66|nr:DNA (cytosine-5-)-methyltransferase [Prevotella sp. KH2C16]SFG42432.1 DNA (cytosine-5)-methyltransferase 1 [Prevotella sp. KH2C16]